MLVQFPCLKCNRAVAKNHKALQCNICDKSFHLACNNLNTYAYNENSKKINLIGIVFVVFTRNYHIAQLAMF